MNNSLVRVRAQFATTRTFWLLVSMVILSLILREMPFFNLLFAPFNQLEVLLHEASHALACVFTGGWVSGLTIVEDGNGHGGLTFTHGGLPFIYMQAGYMGEAIWGCLLIALSRFPKISRGILIALGVCMGIVSIWFMPGGIFSRTPGMLLPALFSMCWGLTMAFALMWIGKKFSNSWAHLTLTFLAVQSCLGSLQGVWVLLLQSFGAFPGTWSDATNMVRLTGIPAVIWGMWWALFSVGLLGWTMWMTYKADQSVPAGEPNIATGPVKTQAPRAASAAKSIDASNKIEMELIELRKEADKGQVINTKKKQNQL